MFGSQAGSNAIEDDWRSAPISTFGKRDNESEETGGGPVTLQQSNAQSTGQDMQTNETNTKREQELRQGQNDAGRIENLVTKPTEPSPFQRMAHCLSAEVDNFICKKAEAKLDTSSDDGSSLGQISEASKEELETFLQTEFTTRFDAVDHQVQKRKQQNERQREKLELLRAKYSFCRLLMTCDCTRLFGGQRMMQNEIEANQSVRILNLHNSKRMGGLGSSAIQQLKDGINTVRKLNKGSENEAGGPSEQKIGMLRQKSNILGESLKDVGGRQLFADEQDRNKISPNETPAIDEPAEDDYIEEEEEHDHVHDEEIDDSGAFAEQLALLEEEVSNDMCERINQRFIQYVMIDPNNRRLMFFHCALSLSFGIDMVFTGFCISSYDFRYSQIDNFMHEKEVYGFIFVMQVIEIILRLFTILEIDICRYEKPLEVISRYLLSLDFITDVATVIPYNRFWPKLIFVRLLRWRKYTDYTDKFRRMMVVALNGVVEPERVRANVEQTSMGFWLYLFAHILACFWMQIGYELYFTEDTGWIREMLDDKKIKSTNPIELYITSIYFVMTSFSSVGYGDVTGNQNVEYLYQCLVEMLGIGIFGYMTGMIQDFMSQITEADPSTQYQDKVMMWLVALDKQRSNPIEKEVFQDVRDYYDNAYKYDTQSFQDENKAFFDQLKPRLQKELMQKIYAFKSMKFQDVFDECQEAFKYEMFRKFEFKFYPLEHQRQQSSNIFDKELVEIPQIERAGEYTRSMYFIINSNVHIMDKEGMYDYGVIGKGGYFGDISILLEKPNAFSYMYDPDESREPLMLYKIDKVDVLSIFEKYPLERSIFMDRAKKRMEFFDNYKSETLLSFMKGIVKNPSVVRQNQKHLNKHYSFLQRLRFLKERNVKLTLFKLFLRHYELQRSLKKQVQKAKAQSKHNHHGRSKLAHVVNVRMIMAKTMSLYNESFNFGANSMISAPAPAFGNKRDPHEDLGYFGTMGQNATMQRRKTVAVTQGSQSQSINDITPVSEQASFHRAVTPDFSAQKRSEMDNQVRVNVTSQSLQNTHQSLPSNIFDQHQDKRHSLNDAFKEGGGPISETIGASSPKQPEVTPYFHQSGANSTISPNKLGLPADEQITEQLDEKSSLCSSQLKGSLKKQPGFDFNDASRDFQQHRRLSEELDGLGDDFCNYKSIDKRNLEQLLVQNMHDIRIVLTEYFRLRDYRKRSIQRQKNSVGGIIKVALKKSRRFLSAKHLDHMDRIIEEYINIEFIQRQILFGRQNLEWLLKDNIKSQQGLISTPKENMNATVATNPNMFNMSMAPNNQNTTAMENTIARGCGSTPFKMEDMAASPAQDQSKNNLFEWHFSPGIENLKKLNFKEELLGREISDALNAEFFLDRQFENVRNEIIKPFVEDVSDHCKKLLNKVDDFEQWTLKLADQVKPTTEKTSLAKKSPVGPKPIIPKDKKKRRNSARPKESPLVEKHSTSSKRIASKDSDGNKGSDQSQPVSSPIPPINVPQTQPSRYKETALTRFFDGLSINQQADIINKIRPQIDKFERSRYKTRFE